MFWVSNLHRVLGVTLLLYACLSLSVLRSPFSVLRVNSSQLVVIYGTSSWDGRDQRYVDCPITDVLQMMGRASRPALDDSGKCAILCHTPRKEYYKKFLYTPLPMESHLDHILPDALNAEIVTRTVENKQDAVDWLTWSLFYRRLARNPNYYNLAGNSTQHISDHLSTIVEDAIDALAESQVRRTTL